MNPFDEAAWSQVIGYPSGVRSIFAPTDVVTLDLIYDNHILLRLEDDTPFEEFSLRPFEYAGYDLSRGCHLNLWLTDRKSLDEESVSCVFTIKWKSYYRRSDGSFKFTYRPNAIFVLLPATSPIHPIGSVVPPTAGGSPKIFLGEPKEQLLPVIRSLKEHFISPKAVRRAQGVRSDPNKSGFGGFPRRPDVNVTIPSYTAIFSSFSPPSVTYDGEISLFSRNVASVNTPNFRKLRKALLPVNPYEMQTIRTQDGGMSSSLESSTGFIHRFQTRSQGTRFPNLSQPGFDSNLYNKTLYKVIERTGSSIEANIAQDVAQIGQLKKLVASTCKKIASSISNVKGGRIYQAVIDLVEDPSLVGKRQRGKNTVGKSVAQQWLEIQYAWKPLLQDIEGLMKTLANTVLASPLCHTVRATSNKERKEKVNAGPLWTSGYDAIYEYRYRYRCAIGVQYTVSDHLISFAQQLGFTNPISLAYEVLPYSFVGDWLLPIGPYLQSLTAWQGMVFRSGFVTQSVSREFSSAFDVSFFSDPITTARETAALQQTWFVMRRDSLLDFPRANLPAFKDPASLTHALNAIALVRARFK